MKAIRTVGIGVLWWSTVLLRGTMAQQPEAIVTAVILPQQVPDTLELELFVQRPSLRWERWINGTLCFTLPDTLPIQWQRLGVRLVPGTTVLDTSVYRIEPFVVWEPIRPGAAFTRPRVGLTVLGPESFQQAQLIPWDTLIRLGRVQIFSLDGSPVLYQWSWAQAAELLPGIRLQAACRRASLGARWTIIWSCAQSIACSRCVCPRRRL
jgi:hypothetical protein